MQKINFAECPIIVLNDDGVACHFIDLDYNPFEEFQILEIFSAGRKEPLGRYEFLGENEYHLLTVERKWLKIKVVYKKLEFDNHGNSSEVILDTVEKSLFERTTKFGIKDVDAEKFDRLVRKVQAAMDTPGGTPAEIEEHTRLLRESTYKEEAKNYVIEKIRNIVTSEETIKNSEIEYFVYKIYSSLYGLGVLQELDDDEEVGEIMVNAVEFPKFRSDIYYVKHQKKYKYDREFENVNDLMRVFNKTIEFSKQNLNRRDNAIIEATRPNRDRVTVVIPDASDNYSLNIRKFSNFVPDKDHMKKAGTVNPVVEELYKILVKGKANVGIGGPMGSGKTTMINYMLTYTPQIERKVVIASVSETDIDRVLKGHDIVIFNATGDHENFTFSNLLRVSLRTTADRVIIPESRGSEFKDLYEANLKTKGNMFTAHATDDESFLDMCVDMYNSSPETGNEQLSVIKNKICKAVDIIVMMVRVESEEEVNIRIQSISEVCVDSKGRYSHMNRLYEWQFDPENPGRGQYYATGNTISESLIKRLNRFGVKRSEIDRVNSLLKQEHNNKKSLY